MNVTEAMEKIEGQKFAAIVNLASDFRTFLRILAAQPEVQAVSAAIKSDQVSNQVREKVLELAESPSDGRNEHPADAAMAAYLWLLSENDTDCTEFAAEKVLGCHGCWWARKMALALAESGSGRRHLRATDESRRRWRQVLEGE